MHDLFIKALIHALTYISMHIRYLENLIRLKETHSYLWNLKILQNPQVFSLDPSFQALILLLLPPFLPSFSHFFFLVSDFPLSSILRLDEISQRKKIAWLKFALISLGVQKAKSFT